MSVQGLHAAGKGVGVMPSLRWLMAGVAGVVASTPGVIKDTLLVIVMFVVLDTCTGMMVAAKARQFRSNRARVSLSSKLAQYSLIACLGWGVNIITHQWAVLGSALGVIVAIEVASIIENIICLERYGGVNLGPARPLLNRISRYFAIDEKKGNGSEPPYTD